MQNPRDFLKTHKRLIGDTAILSLLALGCGHAPGIWQGARGGPLDYFTLSWVLVMKRPKS